MKTNLSTDLWCSHYSIFFPDGRIRARALLHKVSTCNKSALRHREAWTDRCRHVSVGSGVTWRPEDAAYVTIHTWTGPCISVCPEKKKQAGFLVLFKIIHLLTCSSGDGYLPLFFPFLCLLKLLCVFVAKWSQEDCEEAKKTYD